MLSNLPASPPDHHEEQALAPIPEKRAKHADAMLAFFGDEYFTEEPATTARLKSRHPYNKAAQELLRSTTEDLSIDGWLAAAWKQEWERAGPKSTTTSWIPEMAPQETIFHAGNGLC
ncbi:unnamed protein product [Boreogadus saida]